jgi:hypothetical protein
MDEARACVPAKSRGVLNLVLLLIQQCMKERSGRCSLTRKKIADDLGYEGRYADESVRKLVNRAHELGEVLVFEGVGHRAPGQRGHTACVYIPVRLLQYLGALNGARRREVLADPLILEALQAREEALQREIAAGGAPRTAPVLYGRDGVPADGWAAKQAAGPGKASRIGSSPEAVSDLSPEAAPPDVAEGGGAAAPDHSDGAADDGTSSAGQQRPAPVVPSELAEGRPPAPETGPCPSDGTEAREAGPEAPPGAEARGHDDEGWRDPGRLRVELARIQALRAEIVDEARRRAVQPVKQLPPWAIDRERELAATRALDGRIRDAERAATNALKAVLGASRLHRAAREEPVLQTETNADHARRLADYDAQQGPEAPTAWCVIWSLLLEVDDTGRRLAAVARCRARLVGDDLELVAPDVYTAKMVRDLWAGDIATAAAAAGFQGAVRVVAR